MFFTLAHLLANSYSAFIAQLNDLFLREVFLDKFYHTFSYHYVLFHSVSLVVCNAACDSQLMSASFCILLGAQCLQVLHMHEEGLNISILDHWHIKSICDTVSQ